MLIVIDKTSTTPLHEQVAACIRRSLSDGELHPGEKLPSARDVAATVEVNLHTVLRAYQTLRDEGVVELRRGRGAVILARGNHLAAVHELIDQLRTEATRAGISVSELQEMLLK